MTRTSALVHRAAILGLTVLASLSLIWFAPSPCSAQLGRKTEDGDDDARLTKFSKPDSEKDTKTDSDGSSIASPGINVVMPNLTGDSPEVQAMKMMGRLVQPPLPKVRKGFVQPGPSLETQTSNGAGAAPPPGPRPEAPADISHSGGSFSGSDESGGAGASPQAAGGQVAAVAPGDSAPMSSSEQRAAGSAQTLANALKGFSDAGVLPASRPGSPAQAAMGIGGGASGDPSHPRTQVDLLLAPQASLGAVGLKAGRGPDGHVALLTASGAPASPMQISQLYRQVSSDPTALMRYPDLFNRLPGGRAEFDSLKQAAAMRGSASDGPFKDVGLSEDHRDLDWSKSCGEVSGDCNHVVKSKSYQKGEHLPPEDLDAIWDDIKKEMAADEQPKGSGLKARVFNQGTGGLLARLAAAFTGHGSGGDVPSPVAASAPGARGEPAFASGSRAAVIAAAGARPIEALPIPGVKAAVPVGGVGALAAGMSLLAGAAGLAWWLRKRRNIDGE